MLAVCFLMCLLFLPSNIVVASEKQNTFTPTDRFVAQGYNGSIRFATNGSYSTCNLYNGIWTFHNLALSNSSQSASDISIGVKDSNITVFSIRAFNFTGRSTSIRYAAEGVGSQTIKFNSDPQKRDPSEWSVIVYGKSGTVWLAEGQNWNLLPDNTVIVNGLVGNLSVAHYNFNVVQDDSHSILIIAVLVFSCILIAASVINWYSRRIR